MILHFQIFTFWEDTVFNKTFSIILRCAEELMDHVKLCEFTFWRSIGWYDDSKQEDCICKRWRYVPQMKTFLHAIFWSWMILTAFRRAYKFFKHPSAFYVLKRKILFPNQLRCFPQESVIHTQLTGQLLGPIYLKNQRMDVQCSMQNCFREDI